MAFGALFQCSRHAGRRVISGQRPLVLWVDHLETPSLTPRHPVDVDALLWGLREIAQRQPSLRIVLSAREAFSRRLLGPKAAFHQQGIWIPLDNPLPGDWKRVGERLTLPVGLVDQLLDQVDGHPETMLNALLLAATHPTLPHPYAILQEPQRVTTGWLRVRFSMPVPCTVWGVRS